MVIESRGAASHRIPTVLGIYRKVNTFNGRPAFKQDGGEHYLFYFEEKKADGKTKRIWQVGTTCGNDFGWIRSKGKVSSDVSSPDQHKNWEFKPITRRMSELDRARTEWMEDATLVVRPLWGEMLMIFKSLERNSLVSDINITR